MGTFIGGILGPFSGKVGAVVGSSWKGIDYMRGRSRKRRSATGTLEQETHRAKFSLVSKFLRAFRSIISFGFTNLPVNQTAYNAALAQGMEAVVGEYPELKIDYVRTFVTNGKLEKADSPSAVSNTPGGINFSWTDNSGSDDARPDDKAVLLAYCESLNSAVYNKAGATRNSGADTLSAKAFAGKEVHTWIAFVSKDGKQISPSLYCGPVMVQ